MQPHQTNPEIDLERAPEFKRKLVLGPQQIFGLLVLLTIPVLASIGVFGDSRDHGEGSVGNLVVRADTPSSARHGKDTYLKVTVTSQSGALNDRDVEVAISTPYLELFRNVRAWPRITSVDENAVSIRHTIPAGETETWVVLELTPEAVGRAQGTVRVEIESGEPVELALETLVLP